MFEYNIASYSIGQYIITKDSIIKQYGANYESYQREKCLKNLNQKILQEFTQAQKNQANIQKKTLDYSADKMAQFYAKPFKALFEASQHHQYWENGLSRQQKRFEQTAQDLNGIIFVPTIYTAQILQRTLDKFRGKQISVSVQKQYRYFMGLKYNGKSHSEILARLMASYLTDFRVLSIPSFQKLPLSELVYSFCSIITRDLWYHLTPKQMAELQQISAQNSSSQNKYQLTKEEEGTIKSFKFFIKQTFLRILPECIKNEDAKNVHRSNFDRSFQDVAQKKQLLLFDRIIKIINQIQPSVVVIDQLNYFGRKIYTLTKKDPHQTGSIVQIALQMTLAGKLFALHRDVRMFASINDYPYLSLLKIITVSAEARDIHQSSLISYLFEGKQRTKNVLAFLQIILKSQNKRPQLIKLIKSDIFIQILEQRLNVALNLKQCQTLAKFIFKFLQLNQNTLILQLEKKQNQTLKTQILLEKVFLQAFIKIQQSIMNFLLQQISLFCQQAQMKPSQAKTYLTILCSVFLDNNRDMGDAFKQILHFDNKDQQAYEGISNDVIKQKVKQVISNKSKLLNIRSYYNFVRMNPQTFAARIHEGYKQILKKFIVSKRMNDVIQILMPDQRFFVEYQANYHREKIKALFQNNKHDACQKAIKNCQIYIGNTLQTEVCSYLQELSARNLEAINKKISYQVRAQPGKAFSQEELQIKKVNYLTEYYARKDFISKQQLIDFTKSYNEQGTLYVAKTLTGQMGVDVNCVLKDKQCTYVFAIQIGKNKLSNKYKGLIQYANYENTYQQAIIQLKKTYKFRHIITELQQRSSSTIQKLIKSYLQYQKQKREGVKKEKENMKIYSQQQLEKYFQNFCCTYVFDLFTCNDQGSKQIKILRQLTSFCSQLRLENQKKIDKIVAAQMPK